MSVADRFEQLQTFTRESAELLQLPENNERVVLLAALKLSHQVAVERLVAGSNVDPGQLLSLTETIAKLAPTQHAPTIKLEVVEHVTGLFICEHCHQQNRVGNYEAPKPPPMPPTIDGELAKDVARALPAPTAANGAPVETKPEAPPKPLPLWHRDGFVPHVNFRELGAPIKGSAASSYGASLNGSPNPFSVRGSVKPDFDSAHPLPSPGGSHER